MAEVYVQHDPSDVGHGDVHVVLVRRRAPLDAAYRAALANPHLPQDFALIIGIERMDHARFLACEQRPLAVPKRHQNRRRPKIEIRAIGFGTVGLVRQPARGGIRIVGVICRDQRILPVFRSIAMNASLNRVVGSV